MHRQVHLGLDVRFAPAVGTVVGDDFDDLAWRALGMDLIRSSSVATSRRLGWSFKFAD